jgi:radical SAM protein with 4Fe4S-binding SPASM domain
MKKKYRRITDDRFKTDFHKVFGTLKAVAQGFCPVEELDLPVKEIDPIKWTAPARMDLALTYRCNNNCGYCYAGGPKETKELSSWQWQEILANLWQIGIPQVVFTGGEPTLRGDLVELVYFARQFVTGLVTNGRYLSLLANDLMKASLDYVQVSLEAPSPNIHDKMVCAEGAWQETVFGIEEALEAGLYVTTNTTLTRENIAYFPDLLQFGKKLGLKTMACNSIICSGKGPSVLEEKGLSPAELKKALIEAKEIAQEIGIDLQWYSPSCYLELDPTELGLGIKECSAAQYNMTIEPDGSVIPCQSWIHEKCGNIMTDSWTKIWNNPVCIALREHKNIKEQCKNCQHLAICGGGCPLERFKKEAR